MDRALSPVAGAPCTAPPIRHADSAEPYCASSPSRARSPVSPCRVDAKPGSPMPPPLQPSGPRRSREDQPSGRVRFQSATWVRITAAATIRPVPFKRSVEKSLDLVVDLGAQAAHLAL